MQQYNVFRMPLPSSFLVVGMSRTGVGAQVTGALFPVGFDAQFYGRLSGHSRPGAPLLVSSGPTARVPQLTSRHFLGPMRPGGINAEQADTSSTHSRTPTTPRRASGNNRLHAIRTSYCCGQRKPRSHRRIWRGDPIRGERSTRHQFPCRSPYSLTYWPGRLSAHKPTLIATPSQHLAIAVRCASVCSNRANRHKVNTVRSILGWLDVRACHHEHGSSKRIRPSIEALEARKTH